MGDWLVELGSSQDLYTKRSTNVIPDVIFSIFACITICLFAGVLSTRAPDPQMFGPLLMKTPYD